MSARQKAIVAVIVAGIIWGASTPIVKLALTTIPPFVFALLRFWLTAVILLLVLLWRGESLNVKRIIWPEVIAAGFLLVPVNIGLFFFGLNLTTAIDTAVIHGLTPIFTAIVSFLLLKERLNAPTIFGIVIAFIGTLVVIGGPILAIGETGDGHQVLGNLINLAAVLAWVFGSLLLDRISTGYNPLTFTTIAFILGFFSLLPFATVESLTQPNWISMLSWPTYLGLVYVVLGNSIVAYILYTGALPIIGPTAATSASYLMPVAAVLLAIPLLGEKITLPFIVGSAIITIGVFLAETRHPIHPLHKHIHKNT